MRSTTDCEAKQQLLHFEIYSNFGISNKKIRSKTGISVKKYTLLLPWLLCRIKTLFQSSLSLVDIVKPFVVAVNILWQQ